MSLIEKKYNFNSFKIILSIIALLWIILLITSLIPSIKMLGIRPRTVGGLIGIAASPFLHVNMSHLITNTTGLFFLGLIFVTLEQTRAGYIVIPIILFSGLGTWIIGSSGTNHIGASGVIYGLLGYLLTIGIFRKHLMTILLSLIVFFLYGGAIWGVLPFVNASNVSWEGHLCGFLSGIIVANAESRMSRRS